MQRRILFSAVLVLAMSACSSSADNGGSTADASSSGGRTSSGPRRAPAARMYSGTDSVEGVPTRWCEGKDCSRSGAGPSRYLKGDPAGFVYFAMAAKPAAARVEVRRGTRLVVRGTLRPGTSMAYALEVPAGRYVITLIARWEGREARWVFGLTGPPNG